MRFRDHSAQRLRVLHAVCAAYILWACYVFAPHPMHLRDGAAVPAPSAADVSHLPFGAVQGIAHGVPAFSNGGCHMIADAYSALVWKRTTGGAADKAAGHRTSAAGSMDAAVLTSWPLAADLHPECATSSATEAGSEVRRTDAHRHNDDSPTASCHSVFTGMQWQCVEYARRFLIATFGHSFGDVVGAEDIWHNVDCYTKVLPGAATSSGGAGVSGGGGGCDAPVRKFNACAVYNNGSLVLKEGAAPSALQLPNIAVGDLVIWHRQEDMPYGHVAVVVGLPQPKPTTPARRSNSSSDGSRGSAADAPQSLEEDEGPASGGRIVAVYQVPIAEQNFAPNGWAPGTNHSRMLDLVHARTPCADGVAVGEGDAVEASWRLVDPFGYTIIGWMQHGLDDTPRHWQHSGPN